MAKFGGAMPGGSIFNVPPMQGFGGLAQQPGAGQTYTYGPNGELIPK